ncbi:LHFPL tetraspan subfamily member 3 protein-like [Tigriopus californicus]|uniref:LHFPL tetraspan subfamily member 3 protein-like n=1 Tax=Tigriopus californicus TaxID=6832 RepID=UPI0027DA60C0|nr:LHFPL tetraspan subfamily member 3 protein-like [Tigriopus californicus]|eukprot:TCALIF_06542-PA protein Name:"Similar to LHFPL4 Lipoma HMGIC fusion partner-like 4 protein (Bos taurus)" AED:0.01 eAED:0.01 QI:282/1/1/1/0.5/0.66/3/92/321
MESKLDYSMAGGGGLSPGEMGNTSHSQFYTSKYIRHSRAVSIIWAVFTVCSAIINIVVFMSSNWVGDTVTSKGPGHFGLWKFCTVLSSEGTGTGVSPKESVVCIGDLNNFSSILSPAFRAATVFVGLSVIVIVLCVLAFILFCFMKSNSVFEICGTMQFLSGICMAIGILAFPAGWDNDHVRSICGAHAYDYGLGECGIRWAFVLAIIAFFDTWILGILAFTLAHRLVKPPPEPQYMNPASIYKGEINSGFIGDNQSLAGSRKSTTLQPVMMMPHPPHGQMGMMDDGYSDYGQRGPPGRSHAHPPSYRTGPYGSTIQNFQL